MRASPSVGSVRPPVHRPASSATLIASANPLLSMNRPPPSLLRIPEVSESSWNRLAWRSSALRTLSTAPVDALSFYGGQTATRAVVPSAARSATATVSSPVLIGRHEVAARGRCAVVISSAVVVGGSAPDMADHGLAVHDLGGAFHRHAGGAGCCHRMSHLRPIRPLR